ncbi:MAG: Fis family transcriptional regulator [Acidobacteria bacterium RIFCSPLOWO2_02_FULL_65_29]|nr:MAG: Fis family transcriptional regulator [Acidobacteria bacterium RIFCSPLOWO2_02_FULL_65_29]
MTQGGQKREGNPKTVLMIDDDESLRRVVEYNLHEEGYRVLTAADGATGFQAFQAQPVDLVLTDVRMPEMDGLELLTRIKAMQPDLPVIMLTAHGTIHSAVEAMRLGAFDYLTKPFDREQLKAAVRKALEVAALTTENRYLREVVAERFSFANMIAGSRAMRAVTETASRVAQSDATVLLEGESGTGKELLAKAIHFHSSRARSPFVTINCGAIPEQLLESELFGHRRGSFTGAVADKRGKFEAADRGTIFLDEIGELPTPLQVKILRVLQEREVDKVGETRPIKVDVRVMAATNRDLEKMVADGAFRDDLYYRLAVVSIRVPPLRERSDDIPFLVDHFLVKHAERLTRPRPSVDKGVYSAFNLYSWPGNIRELENVIERALVLDADGVLGLDDLPERLRTREHRVANLRMELPDEGVSLEDVERELLLAALHKHNWNQTRAAAFLDITRSTLLYRMQKFGLEREKTPAESTGDA